MTSKDMGKRLLSAIAIAAVFAGIGTAQQTKDANPGHTPDVFLDNHRPLISKKGKPPTTRTVTGKVVDEGGQPLEGALVTLTDGKTNQKTTVITKKDGRYNFDDLSFTIDYQLQARYKDQVSDPRKLSQYDRSANVVRILEIGASSNAPAPSAEAKKEPPPEAKK
jgi:hypothetical protein